MKGISMHSSSYQVGRQSEIKKLHSKLEKNLSENNKRATERIASTMQSLFGSDSSASSSNMHPPELIGGVGAETHKISSSTSQNMEAVSAELRRTGDDEIVKIQKEISRLESKRTQANSARIDSIVRSLRDKIQASSNFIEKVSSNDCQYGQEVLALERSHIDHEFFMKKGELELSFEEKKAQIEHEEATLILNTVNKYIQMVTQSTNALAIDQFSVACVSYDSYQSMIEEESIHYSKENYGKLKGENVYNNQFIPPQLKTEFILSTDEMQSLPRELQLKCEGRPDKMFQLILGKDELEQIGNKISSNYPGRLVIIPAKTTLDPRLQSILDTRVPKEVQAALSGVGNGIMIGGGAALLFIPPVGTFVGGAMLSGGISGATNTVKQSCGSSKRFDGKSMALDVGIGTLSGAISGGFALGGGALIKEGASTTAKILIPATAGLLGGGVSSGVGQVIRNAAVGKAWNDGLLMAVAIGAGAGAAGGAIGAASQMIAKGGKELGDMGVKEILSTGYAVRAVAVGGFMGGLSGGGIASVMTIINNAINRGSIHEVDFISILKEKYINPRVSKKIWDHLTERGVIADGRVNDIKDIELSFPPHLKTHEDDVRIVLTEIRSIWRGVWTQMAQGALIGGVMGAVTAASGVKRERDMTHQLIGQETTGIGSGKFGESIALQAQAEKSGDTYRVHTEDGVKTFSPSGGGSGNVRDVLYSVKDGVGHYEPCNSTGQAAGIKFDTTSGDCLYDCFRHYGEAGSAQNVRLGLAEYIQANPSDALEKVTFRELQLGGYMKGGSILDARGRAVFDNRTESNADADRRMGEEHETLNELNQRMGGEAIPGGPTPHQNIPDNIPAVDIPSAHMQFARLPGGEYAGQPANRPHVHQYNSGGHVKIGNDEYRFGNTYNSAQSFNELSIARQVAVHRNLNNLVGQIDNLINQCQINLNQTPIVSGENTYPRVYNGVAVIDAVHLQSPQFHELHKAVYAPGGA